jgi:tetratricopeptide (TPR) repeat protein
MMAVVLWTSVAGAGDLAEARRLWLVGKFAEAQEAYDSLAAKEPVAAALGKARCRTSVGKYDEARDALADAVKSHPDDASLHAALAELALNRGDYETADREAAAALAADPEQLLARWVQAERLRLDGKLTEADAAYKWFVDFYNDNDVDDPDELRTIGWAAAQFARWNRLTDQFTFLVNDLYPSALEADKDYWPARYETGLLFLEKYNDLEASKELKAALEINPSAAEVHAALAKLSLQNYDLDDARRSIEHAREFNPRLIAAELAQADSHLANFEVPEAISLLEKTRELNPNSEETLGRLAAAYAVKDGIKDDVTGTRFGKLAEEVDARNKHCGVFYSAVGSTFDLTRKYPAAARYYKVAVERMPQLTEPRGQLGLIHMRLGEETEAKQQLDESFEIDPFNVRVSNSLKVLEVLDGYAVIETEHFIIRFDRGKDEVLARMAAKHLEENVYPELTKKFGFEPASKSLFEIFNRAKNTNGHGWFSARMVGLPYIGTVGACAGKMVAMASPTDMPTPYNWARVLKHEFVHVLNLQQSNFNIPHWYTEALAVESEGYPRLRAWDEMLVERVPKGKMFNLDTINLGFVRPKSGEDWQMAYCQAQLYAQYMLATYGDDALAKMLDCYRDNLDTRAALKRSFDVDQTDFEAGYLKHVKKLVASLASDGDDPDTQAMTFAQLVRGHEEKPDDLDISARLAEAYVTRKAYPDARKLAESVLDKQPQHPLASYALAKVWMVVGDNERALELLEQAVDPKQPEKKSLELLASLKLAAEKYDEAADLYAAAKKKWPNDVQWTKALARLYLKTGDNKKLAGVLEALAQADADDFVVRKKLAFLALEAKNHVAAARWAVDALHVNVMDADLHRICGESLAAQSKYPEAIDAYKIAIQLDAKQPAWRFALADACLQAGDTQQAREVLKKLIDLNPEYPGADLLLDSLEEKPAP